MTGRSAYLIGQKGRWEMNGSTQRLDDRQSQRQHSGARALPPVPRPEPVMPEGYVFDQVDGRWTVVQVVDAATC